MNTRLIYVNKSEAIVNAEDGTFLNAVSEGVVVNVGDTISVEGIAVDSRGVGTDVIEIPSRLSNYDYVPNTAILNVMFYIHHNYLYDLLFPTEDMTADSYFGSKIDPLHGYYTAVDFEEITSSTNFQNLHTINDRDQKLAGHRFYIGCFDENPNFPTGSDTSRTDPELFPINRVFNFIETDLEVDVDVGYDNPTNIANKITQDLHNADPTPQSTVLVDADLTLSTVPTSYPEINYQSRGFSNQYPQPLFQYTNTSKNSSVQTIRAFPRTYDNDITLPSGEFYSIYQSPMIVANPFYWYWGSRLLCGNVANGGTAKNNAYLTSLVASGDLCGPTPLNQGDIYNLNTLEDNAADIDGYVVVSNLPYNTTTLLRLREFIHSQKVWEGGASTVKHMKTSGRVDFSSDLIIGRVNPLAGSEEDNILNAPLQSPLLCNAGDVALTLENLPFKTFYNDESFSRANTYDTALKALPQYEILYNSQIYTSRQLAKLLDINVIAVDTGVNNEINVGFVLTEPDFSGDTYKRGNYFLVDFAFGRKEANGGILLNPTTIVESNGHHIVDYVKLINVGSPNVNLDFDTSRSRFGFKDMAWGNYIDSGDQTEAVATAGQPAISVNHNINLQYGITQFQFSHGGEVPPFSFLKYSQSGIGIRDIKVVDFDGNVSSIDKYDKADIKKKYNNSLFDRLGFSYEQLVDWFGLPDIIFTRKHYQTNQSLDFPNYFPYPLTNNYEFDTALNLGLSVNDSNLPMFNLQLERNAQNINIEASTTTTLAINLPKKLIYPYWLIKTDIIDGIQYTADGEPQNIIAVCNRAYIAGGFSYSFATDYVFKATHSFVITGINTAILNPNLSPADIDDGTCVIYKIQSPIPMFEPPPPKK